MSIDAEAPPPNDIQAAFGTLAEVQAVCFDLGGTLIKIGSKPTTGLIAAQLGISLEQARHMVEHQAKRHRCAPADLAATLAKDFGRPESQLVLEQILTDAQQRGEQPRLYADVAPALRMLRQRGYRVFALSNALGSSAPLDRPAFHELFDAVVTSYDTGWCKPEPEAFDAVRRYTDLEPNQFLHVGDSPRADAEGALAAGWHAVLLTRPGETSDDAYLPSRVPRLHDLATLLDMLPAAA